MKYTDSTGRYVQYKDIDGVICYSMYKHSSVEQFRQWCKECGVSQLDNFTDIKFKEELK